MYKINITQTNPHTFGIYLSSGYYYFKLYWIDAENAGWYLDIKDSDLNNLVCGIPLVCNTNLTRQYKYKVPSVPVNFSLSITLTLLLPSTRNYFV